MFIPLPPCRIWRKLAQFGFFVCYGHVWILSATGKFGFCLLWASSDFVCYGQTTDSKVFNTVSAPGLKSRKTRQGVCHVWRPGWTPEWPQARQPREEVFSLASSNASVPVNGVRSLDVELMGSACRVLAVLAIVLLPTGWCA